MTEFLKRATLGLVFTWFAAALIHIHQGMWAALPAAAGVYLLAVTLWDAVRRNY